MKPITLIIGAPGTGKTFLSNKLCQGNRTLLLTRSKQIIKNYPYRQPTILLLDNGSYLKRVYTTIIEFYHFLNVLTFTQGIVGKESRPDVCLIITFKTAIPIDKIPSLNYLYEAIGHEKIELIDLNKYPIK